MPYPYFHIKDVPLRQKKIAGIFNSDIKTNTCHSKI